ncbi:S66 peptidase family protein [Clostridium sp. MSJ-8]|uniref:S66 family peptidase n=1 Tax=Clostridium sp. MSJ-8 TaxID=2841510 RepID=UPI00209CE977|nr:S66 peptidase family protein [Clostridium sp. MSJ-8]
MLKINDKVALVACSNGLKREAEKDIEFLSRTLQDIGLNLAFSNYIYAKESVFNASAKERGEALMNFYMDEAIRAIFDISGGDVANGVLPYLDYDIISNNPKPFFGYSDLTTIINGIYAKTGNKGYLYQVRNLIYDNRDEQVKVFTESMINNGKDLFNFDYKFLQGKSMKGVVIGGNIRCFLKLAGTEYMPSFKGKILMLESLGGDVGLMSALLTQLKLLGAFEEVEGIVLGTFTNMESRGLQPTIEELVMDIVADKNLPIIKTRDIGHGVDSRCIIIGEEYEFTNRE